MRPALAEWPDLPALRQRRSERITKLEGKAHRPGLYKCNECREQFTVTVGTVFERSKIALNKWLLATFLMASSKKGMCAHQLHRMLGVTYKTAWFMAHRIREAMKEDVKSPARLAAKARSLKPTKPISAIAKRRRCLAAAQGHPHQVASSASQKRVVVGLVERGGKARMFHVEHATKATVRDVLVRNADRKSTLYTDEGRLYTAHRQGVRRRTTPSSHSAGEYVRYEGDTRPHQHD